MSLEQHQARLRSELNVADPGASGTIKSSGVVGAVCKITTAAAEARTLAAPYHEGETIRLVLESDGGDCTVTVTNGKFEASYNAGAMTAIASLTLSAVGEGTEFIAVDESGTLYWYVAKSLGGLLAS